MPGAVGRVFVPEVSRGGVFGGFLRNFMNGSTGRLSMPAKSAAVFL